MKVLVTGSTGFIGFHVAKTLRDNGCHVRALVRQGSPADHVKSLGIETAEGDIRDPAAVKRAVRGCRQVYHVAADYRLWTPDPDTMYDTNVRGTRNVMECSRDENVERVIYTSSVGVLACSTDGTLADEDTPSRLEEMVGHYKRSKFLAEQEVRGFIKRGLPAVVVNPSTPVGPMDRKPTPTGQIIVDFLSNRMPAYLDTGLNFVDVEDVARGHWLAGLHGRTGQRYILGNSNMTLREFLETLARTAGKSPPRIRLPYLPVLIAAYINEALSNWIVHRPPKIPLVGVKMARKFMFFNCSKAVSELRMPQNPVAGALERAVAWFRENNYVKN